VFNGLDQVDERVTACVDPLGSLICLECYKLCTPRNQKRYTYSKEDSKASIYCYCRWERLETKCQRHGIPICVF
jgi:hypothetical protein